MMSRKMLSTFSTLKPAACTRESVFRFISVPLRLVKNDITSRVRPRMGSRLRTCSNISSLPAGRKTRKISLSTAAGSGTEHSVQEVTTVAEAERHRIRPDQPQDPIVILAAIRSAPEHLRADVDSNDV